ncbi:MAG TPA: hypothetical protein VKY74_00920 [Chloroflexia bacterium]|nr:hypothetical protein [Chloroflexia bacterium]
METPGSGPTRAEVLAQAGALLQDGQPRKAKQIAAELGARGLAGVEKSLVNSVLSREGAGQFVYDPGTYTYTVADPTAPPGARAAPPAGRPAPAGDVPAPSRQAVLGAAHRLLADRQPRTARQIARALTQEGLGAVDKTLINSILKREGQTLVQYDPDTFTYTLPGAAAALPAAEPEER